MATISNRNISPQKQKLIVYIFLIAVTLAVFFQVRTFDFISVDDHYFVNENHVRSGITLNGLYWAFSHGSIAAGYWHPLNWLSFMIDYQLFGLNAGGYHVTNLIFHILSALLLFWLFNRMTGSVWRSAFVAAFFAVHPNHVEAVAWVSGRKDVLGAFFWMLTLCFYVYYTEKPDIRRYLLVLFSFACGLMSKPIVVTLPVVMLLLDYWPLKRFESQKGKVIFLQLKEKTPLFILSAVFSAMTLLIWRDPLREDISMSLRLKNAPVAFVTYLEKILWPHDIHFWHLFSDRLLLSHVVGAFILMILISVAVVMAMKRLPYFFTGWFWYTINILPVLGITQYGVILMHEHYTYLPSIGISVMLAWGVPLLFNNLNKSKKLLLPAGIMVLVILVVISWRQCSYWKNSFSLFGHGIKISAGNDLAMEHLQLGLFLLQEGKTNEAIGHFNKVVSLKSYFADALVYHARGIAYARQGQYPLAIEDFNKAIGVSSARINITNHNYRGLVYAKLGLHENAMDDFNHAIRLDPHYADSYNNRAMIYLHQKNYFLFCNDAREACRLGNCVIWEAAKKEKYCR